MKYILIIVILFILIGTIFSGVSCQLRFESYPNDPSVKPTPFSQETVLYQT